MGNVAGVMKKVNESVNTEETAKIMQQFAVENEKMNMSEEMMDDALIDAVRAERISFFFVTQEASTKLITPVSTISRDGCQWKEEHRVASLCRPHTLAPLAIFDREGVHVSSCFFPTCLLGPTSRRERT